MTDSLQSKEMASPQSGVASMDSAQAGVGSETERTIARLRASVAELVEALRCLITAVTYAGAGKLPNDAGEGYMARVPEQFVAEAKAALAKYKGGE
jgi:hypothetical protein